MALRKNQPSPAEGEFLFEIDETPLEETLTAFGGLALFLRAARSLGVGAGRTGQRRCGWEALNSHGPARVACPLRVR